MPEFTPPTFGEEPREESPGEAQQRYASLINSVANYLGAKLSVTERERLGRFIVNVLAQLTAGQQKALAELVGKLLAWSADRYTGGKDDK